MFKRYVGKLAFRVIIFISVIYIYFFNPTIMELIFSKKIYGRLIYLYIIWGILMVGMILQLVPKMRKSLTMGCLKHHKALYIPSGLPYEEDEKKEFIRTADIGAVKVLIAWLALTAVLGILYFNGVIDQKILLLCSLFFYVCDLICVVVWCPFQSFMMKNKCCVNCRIFNWGYPMMFTPLIFIKSFFSWSLVFVAIVIAVKWEITWYHHPERYWHRTNADLLCKNCKEKICKFKGKNFTNSIMHEMHPEVK